MPTERERDLLVLSGCLFVGSAEASEVLELLQEPLNWARLIQLAEWEGMSGLLAYQLQRMAQSHEIRLPLPRCMRLLHGIFVANGAFFGELAALCRDLRQHARQVILLKGGALIETVYGRQLGLRPLSDLDLLVRDRDLALIKEILHQRGFRSPSAASGFYTNGQTVFDLHTDLLGTSRISRRALAFHFDHDALWRDAVPLTPADPCVLILSPVHQFLHVAVHALKHSFSRLIWFIDLALLTQHLSWDHLLHQAAAFGTLRPLAYALHGLKRLLRVEAPPHVCLALPHLSRVEQLFCEAVASRRDIEVLGELIVALSIRGLRDKLGYLLELSFPNRRVLAEVDPSTPHWLVYPRRLVKLLAIAVRQISNFSDT